MYSTDKYLLTTMIGTVSADKTVTTDTTIVYIEDEKKQKIISKFTVLNTLMHSNKISSVSKNKQRYQKMVSAFK